MPSVHALVNHLAKFAPVFAVNAARLTFLKSPREFYDTIIRLINTSEKRILFATLYLGNEELERELVGVLKKRLDSSSSTELKCHVHMDYLRGTRDGPGPSSVTLLKPLLPFSNFRLSLYLTSKMQGQANWRKLLVPKRWNEIFGLSHMKFCVFDNTVIITGANLSKSYFTDRADRYLVIEDHPKIADYFQNLLNKIDKLSFTAETAAAAGKDDLIRFVEPREIATDSFEEFVKEEQWEHFADDSSIASDGPSTFIIPTIQMTPLGIMQDEFLLEQLVAWFSNHHPNVKAALATGYFNISPQVQRIITQLNSIKTRWRILTSSPKANGFYGSPGASGLVPAAYRSIEAAFICEKDKRPYLDINSLGSEGIYEWENNDWTFHAKGLWLDSSTDCSLIATVIGSSNFGHRSFERDLEAQLTLITNCPTLMDRITNERDQLFANAKLMTLQDLEACQVTRPSLAVKRLTSMIKTYL